ncbi:hypothetical protein B0H11DRAFT_1939298 [Mycena galericulata]|nr:hypothetical protein B0H11DRAFT_1939298 [Mycena galericulata]
MLGLPLGQLLVGDNEGAPVEGNAKGSTPRPEAKRAGPRRALSWARGKRGNNGGLAGKGAGVGVAGMDVPRHVAKESGRTVGDYLFLARVEFKKFHPARSLCCCVIFASD